MNEEYIIIKMDDGTVYAQRTNVISGSKSQLTTKEKVIIYLYNELQKLNKKY